MKLVETLVKLYNLNPDCIGKFNRNSYKKYLKEELIKIKNEPPKNLELKTLDSYLYKDSLIKIFAYLPSDKVQNNFGDEILFYSALRMPYNLREKRICEGIENVFNGSEKKIENMRLFLWQRYNNSKSKDVFNLWNIYRKINKNFTDNFDLEKNLKENLRVGYNLSKEKIGKYSLEPFKVKSDSTNKEKN